MTTPKGTSSETETQAPSGAQICPGSQASQKGKHGLHHHEGDLWERVRREGVTPGIPGEQK